MSDFRTALYSRYVSTFKGEHEALDPEQLRSFFAWCSDKYLPLLSGLARDEPILEVGCGPGYLLEFLSEQGFSSVAGVDISEEQVGLATARGLRAEVGDVFAKLEAGGGRYQAIVAVDFVEHFTREELMRLLPLLHAALKPEGLLLLQTPNGAGLFPNQIVHGDLTHLTIFTPDSLRQLLRLHGFEHFEFRETGPAASGLKGRIRSLAWRSIRLAANLVRRIETGKTQAIWTENVICACRRTG